MSAQIVPFPTRPRLAVVRETDAELIDLSDAMEREQIERLRRAPQVLRLATLSKIVEHMTFLIDTRTAIIWAIGEGHYANAEAAIDELRETQPAPETPPRAAAPLLLLAAPARARPGQLKRCPGRKSRPRSCCPGRQAGPGA